MKNLRRDFERFCYRHRDQGIRNLMLYIAIGTAIMYIFSLMDSTQLFYRVFSFDRASILRGQVWRLFTYILLPGTNRVLTLAISLYFYYFVGRSIEAAWGTFRFNLFYFSGVIITDAAALLLGVNASSAYLNLSMVLAFATLYPENRVLLFYIIPIKMKYLAWFYFALTIYEILVYPLALKIFVICALLNYFLFFGSDVLRVLPNFLRPRRSSQKPFGSFTRKQQKPNPDWASNYRSKTGEQPYRHKCTVCGRTDTQYPMLEFRYCSRCSGYYCYCIDHINDHAHIQ